MNDFRLSVIAGAIAIGLGLASPMALAADEHAHGHGAAPTKLQLDHGKKWATDEPLRRGMAAIRAIVQGAPAPLHKATASAEAYAPVGSRIEAEVGRIVAECKLPPAADAQLHVVITEIIAGADAMKDAKSPAAGRSGLVKVDTALRTYAKYFAPSGL